MLEIKLSKFTVVCQDSSVLDATVLGVHSDGTYDVQVSALPVCLFVVACSIFGSLYSEFRVSEIL